MLDFQTYTDLHRHTHKSETQKPPDLLELCEEVVDHVFDLRGLGREQDQLLVDQIELQHVLGWNRHKQDVRVAEQEMIRKRGKSTWSHREKREGSEVKSLEYLTQDVE